MEVVKDIIPQMEKYWELKRIRQSTLYIYRSILNLIITDIGNIPVQELTYQFLYDYIRSKNYTAKYLINWVIVLNSIIDVAYDYQLIQFPFKIKPPSILNKEIEYLEEKDFNKLKLYLLENLNYELLGYLITAYTGLRIGELCALTFSNIDYEKRCINILNSIQRITSKNSNNKTALVIGDTKTKSSVRKIPIPESLFNVLVKFKGISNHFILTNNTNFMKPHTVRNHFKKILIKAEIENKMSFHGIRHSFATDCLNHGMEIKILSAILGHSDVRITMNTYLHVNMAMKRNEMNKLKLPKKNE